VIGLQDLGFTPRQAVGFALIPLFNIFHFPFIVNRLWKAASARDWSDGQWLRRSLNPLGKLCTSRLLIDAKAFAMFDTALTLICEVRNGETADVCRVGVAAEGQGHET